MEQTYQVRKPGEINFSEVSFMVIEVMHAELKLCQRPNSAIFRAAAVQTWLAANTP